MSNDRREDAFDRIIAEVVAEKAHRGLLGRRAHVAGIIAGLMIIASALVLASGAFGWRSVFTGHDGAAQPQIESASPDWPSDAATSSGDFLHTDPSESEPLEAHSALVELVDPDWAEQTSASTGIPLRALQAYAGAALLMGEEEPECGLGWNTLAAIGAVESHHGTVHGAFIRDDGYPSSRIVGVALTGEGFAHIPDTDGGHLDGDTTWDRAVGPMQFIPSTWRQWSADGNGDGNADPQQIDDAVLAAARYLCFTGNDLSDPDNWVAAVTSYNHSIEYNNHVADVAQDYKDATELESEQDG